MQNQNQIAQKEEFPHVDELKTVYPHLDLIMEFLDNKKDFVHKKLEKDRANIKGKYEPWRNQIEQTRLKKEIHEKNLRKKEKDFNEACNMEQL